MATYVARIERDGKTVLERADVTVEILDDGGWRARFLVPSGIRLPRETELGLAFADGRHGQARIDHIHPAAPKSGARLVELSGIGPLG
jgi:hypothetical protein